MSRCVLFLLNARGYGYGYGCEYGCSGCGSCTACKADGETIAGLPWISNSGLFNSCAFVVDMLNASGIGSKLIQVNTLGDIQHAIANCSPTDVVIEAFFVTPANLAALAAQYPLIRWVVRLHSEIPFLIQEGMAMHWMFSYLQIDSVSVAVNTLRARGDLQTIVRAYYPHWDQLTLNHRVEFLPNYYPTPAPLPRIPSLFGVLNVACMGAIRPLKNQMLQAVAALSLAAELGKKLVFHINGTRIEGGVPAVLTNLRAMFSNTVNAGLVEHQWLPRPAFLDLCRRMDLCMQVSLSETFNIVAADFATNNIPLLVSPEITWADPRIQAHATDTGDMVFKAKIAMRAVSIIESNRAGLLKYNDRSRQNWLDVFGSSAPGWTDAPHSFVGRPVITSLQTHMG